MRIIISLSFSFLLLLFGNAYAAEPLSSGDLNASFSSWGQDSVAGSWEIVKEGDEHFVVLAENFKAKGGPDVKIFLSTKNEEAITGANATDGAVFVSLLSEFEGSARYKIPASVSIESIKTLVFHCEAYSKLWGTSPLN